MSKTWQRRPKRRNPIHAKQKHATNVLRTCCSTHGQEPHASTCGRHPAMCGDKAAFERGAAAKLRAKGYSAANADGSSTWRAYECPWCGLFHLTSQPDS